MLRVLGLSIVFWGLSVSTLPAENWPAWRGPTGDGQTTERNLPTKWSATENVRWKVALPDDGASSPVVWGDKVFVTCASEKVDWPPSPRSGGPASAHKRSTFCFHRADGKKLWQQDVLYKEKESTHSTNPFCSASPVTDGERVVVSHGSAGMYCYDLDGKELWKKDLGQLEHIWGNASSPILYKDLAILWCGPGKRQFLLAVNKKDGETVWEHQEPGGLNGGKQNEWRGSWCTPIIVKVNDHDELIVSTPYKLKAFDPANGKELWSCDGAGRLSYASPVHANGIVVNFSGYGGEALACKVGGKGDVTNTHRLWQLTRANPQRIGSPIIVGDRVLIVNQEHTAQVFELTSGRQLGDKLRVGSANTWCSPVAAGNTIYVLNSKSECLVLQLDAELKLLHINELAGEHCDSSLAVSDGDLFIRTYKHLWCISEKK